MRRLQVPPWLAGGPATAPEVKDMLVRSLFTQDATLRASVFAMFLTGLICAWRVHALWPLVWFVAATPFFVDRVYVTRLYLRDPGARTPEAWAQRFAIGSWGIAAFWGLAGAAVGFIQISFVQMAIIGVQAGYVSVAATRNNGSPAVALGQVAITLLPTSAGLLTCGDKYMVVFSIFTVLHILAAFKNVQYLSEQTLRLVDTDHEQALLVTEMARLNADLENANSRLATLSTTDRLTGLTNRLGFENALDAAWQQSLRHQKPVSLLMIDVDYFKRFNDTYGHIAGDVCLKDVAQAIQRAISRAGDVACRYGGEEFVIILPSTDSAGAVAVASAARSHVERLHTTHTDSDLGHVTISVGCATLAADKHQASGELVRMADAALYESKRRGRNQVQTYFVPATAMPSGELLKASNLDHADRAVGFAA